MVVGNVPIATTQGGTIPPTIRITPSILRDSGNDLGHTRADIARVGLEVLSAGARAPSYDGQFGSPVRDMAAEANARVQAFAERLGEYSGRLTNKAEAFEMADLVGVAGLRPIGLPVSWRARLQLLQQLARWLDLPTGLIELYLRLGLLAALGLLAPHLISAMVIRSGFQIGWRGRTFAGNVATAGLRALFQRSLSGWVTRGAQDEKGGDDNGTPVPPSTDPLAEARQHHILQFEDDPDDRNADCGPTSVVIALHALGMRVKDEPESSSKFQAIGLARQSMAENASRDGVDALGNQVDAEHSKDTSWAEIERGATSTGATVKRIGATSESIRSALRAGGKVIVSGTFVNKQPADVWTGDRKGDLYSAPAGAKNHVIAVTGFDEASGMFVVNDPARKDPFLVEPGKLELFMEGNPGARSVTRPSN